MKKLLAFAILISANIVYSQDLLMKTVTQITMEGVNSDDFKQTMTIFQKGTNVKIQMESKDNLSIHSYIGDSVKIFTKEKGYNDLCAEGTRDEFKEVGEKKKMEYKDLVVEKTNDTKTILGYKCKKTIIKYSTSTMGFTLKTENTLWCTDNVNFGGNAMPVNPNDDRPEDEYQKAVKDLGILLKQETRLNGRLTSTMDVVTLEKKNFTLNDIDIVNSCKSVLTLEEYKKAMDNRQMLKDKSNQERYKSYNRNH